VKASIATEHVRKSESQVSISPPPIVLKEGRKGGGSAPWVKDSVRGRLSRTC
jgi:hypothetical protein